MNRAWEEVSRAPNPFAGVLSLDAMITVRDGLAQQLEYANARIRELNPRRT